MLASYRIGIDIGGTFTDFTAVNDLTGEALVEKCLTTPDRPDVGVMKGLRALATRRPDVVRAADAIIHATTLLTNVLIERKGGKVGLLTTEGFRDVLEFARELRYDIYDPFIDFPAPIVPRSQRLGVGERVLVDGSVARPLDEESVRDAIATLRDAGIASLAVSFLHSYANDAHERRVAEIASEIAPELHLSLSSEVHPEPKEFERTSTTAVDAYVKPIAARYLDDLSRQLGEEGYRNSLFMMLSNGGTATAAAVKRFPVQAVESGPAAGVEAAKHFGRLMGESRLLSFDMGGTTAKLCLVEDGKATRTNTFEVDRVHRFKPGSGLPIAIPVYDLLEIGAGGGSIARVDSLGLLQVGPDSAGSSPGPACYGLGGAEPTVTDADLVLGYLDARTFLGGTMDLDRSAAERALETRICAPSGLDLAAAAFGIHNLVNETMASAARVYVAEKGQTCRDLALVGFGGAGPLHAVGLARKLGCPRVIVPPLPGVMSSFGLLAAPVALERSRSLRRLLQDTDPSTLEEIAASLEQEAAALLPAGLDVTFERAADLMRAGQDYAIEMALEGRFTDEGARETIASRFADEYRRLYGRVDDETPLELVSLRVRASHAVTAPTIAAPSAKPAPAGVRTIYSPAAGGYVEAAVHQRSDLAPGSRVAGPAVIEERESTLVFDAGDTLTVNAFGALVIELAA